MNRWLWMVFITFFGGGCVPKSQNPTTHAEISSPMLVPDTTHLGRAYFAAGCFWCVEAVFESVLGVREVVSGYAGGGKRYASYEDVSSGDTGHAEAVMVVYDTTLIRYETLLTVFFDSHDPTTLNRQGYDVGTQYRSAIFYTTPVQKSKAEAYIQKLNADGTFDDKVVTTLEPFTGFYPAEDYHQDYEKNHPNNPYIRNVSIPRLHKFKDKHPELLKTSE